MIIKPALIWKVKPSETKDIKVSYITKGLRWTANYVITLGEEDFILAGWANIENNSGTSYENARVKLIAGEVKRIEEDEHINDVEEDRVLYSPASSSNFSEEIFSDYHMYSLQLKIDERF